MRLLHVTFVYFILVCEKCLHRINQLKISLPILTSIHI
jgi:hypothetical protein